MTITVNGEKKIFAISEPFTVAGLLAALGVKPGAVAVELNLGIIERSAFDTQPVKEGDTVEIIRMVGGG